MRWPSAIHFGQGVARAARRLARSTSPLDYLSYEDFRSTIICMFDALKTFRAGTPIVAVIVVLFVYPATAPAQIDQSSPSFEAASVKLVKPGSAGPGPLRGGPGTNSPGLLRG